LQAELSQYATIFKLNQLIQFTMYTWKSHLQVVAITLIPWDNLQKYIGNSIFWRSRNPRQRPIALIRARAFRARLLADIRGAANPNSRRLQERSDVACHPPARADGTQRP
jgi:hypothetical protein